MNVNKLPRIKLSQDAIAKRGVLQNAGYFVGYRDPGAQKDQFIVSDDSDADGYKLVGSDMEALIHEAFEFLSQAQLIAA